MKNLMQIDKSGMIVADQISDDDPIEKSLLIQRAQEARDYLMTFNWCRSIRGQWLAGGFSHVTVFAFEIDSIRYDEELWVVVGDLPPAHLVVDDIPDVKEVLLSYVFHMRNWVEAVKSGQSTNHCMPVNVSATIEHASLLESRLNFIEKEYVPSL
jgi:hypothetical protein